MSVLQTFDRKFIGFSKKHYSWIARVSLFIIYFYFGFLKIVGASPASDLALGFANKMGMGAYGTELYIALAFVECLIGLLILFPRLTRIALFFMFGHMLLVCAPIILYPEAVWQAPFVPNLEGQYIIKNAALVALALGLVAHTAPLTSKSKKRI
jgi:uncharacterized membrane protein YphA (DoxX/SURF4 family)